VRGKQLEGYYDLIRRLVKGFEVAGVDYVFTGALAVSFYGVPRTTVDVESVKMRAKMENTLSIFEAIVGGSGW